MNGPHKAMIGARRQGGMTTLGMIILVAFVGMFVFAGIRLTPVYLNYMKVAGVINGVQEEFDGFCNYIWNFVGGKPIQNRIRKDSDFQATSPESDALSKDLKKRGFKFVGSTIIYAHMQATGMVNDHEVSCFRHKECAALAKRK